MGIDSGFAFDGFVDDREEKEMWGNVEKKLSNKDSDKLSASGEEDIIDGKMEINDEGKSDWSEEMQKNSIKEYKNKKSNKNQGFFKRNKREIFDALILLGVIYVGYKLFFENDGGEDFDAGGEVDYNPTPQSMPEANPAPAPASAPPPPRPELPEATFNPEK